MLKEITRLFVFWTIMCVTVIPILNFMVGHRLKDGILFVYLTGIGLACLALGIWQLAEVIV